MKGTVRIIAGRFRGKVIPFQNSSYGDADITPQKVKGALFSIIGEQLHGRIFVDLFSGSGQIGFEAVSRGADTVIFNEADRSRYNFIREFSGKLSEEQETVVLNLKASDALRYIKDRGISADIIFIDPPYEKIKGEADSYNTIINGISESGVLNPGGVIVVQHFSSNSLAENCSGYKRISLKKYGTTSLSVYTAG